MINYIVKESIRGFIATLLMGIGIATFVACELGSDPITVFLDGLNRTTGLSIGLINLMLNILIFVLALMLNRNKLGIATAINVIMLGLCIDVPAIFISELDLSSKNFVIRFIALLISQCIFAFSIGWMQTFQNGISSLDAVFYRIMKRTKIKYKTIRFIYDGTYLLVGFLLGGIVGIGTLISLATTGILTIKSKLMIEFIKKGGIKIWMKRQFSQQ